MTLAQLQDYAEEHFENPDRVLQLALQALIDDQGWSQSTTLAEAVRSHSRALEKKVKLFAQY